MRKAQTQTLAPDHKGPGQGDWPAPEECSVVRVTLP